MSERQSVRIFYYETTAHYPSSAHFLEALKMEAASRPGFGFKFFDEAQFMGGPRSIAERIATRILTGRPFSCGAMNRAMAESAVTFKPDIVLIGKGRFLSPTTLCAVKSNTGAILINWSTDDPFNPANGSDDLRASIPLYDLYVSTKRAIIPDLIAHGARRTAYIRFGYKDGFHFPERPANEEERVRFDCDVAFIGGADSDRVPYFEELVRTMPRVRLNLYGAYWHRYRSLRRFARGEVVGRDYRLAIGGAKVVVNLVRRSNRDDHVMRTFEIPACGGFMLAERTATHLELFAEGRDAAFFSTPAEMAGQVAHYLSHPEERLQITDAGRDSVSSGTHSYRDRLFEILDAALGLDCGAARYVSSGSDIASIQA
jgi:spore maturation protein CgeB